ncbi:MAG TPA: DUF1552 domain-containing protein [Chthoniobacteraceae bacterium]|jgi:hypothetical protein|nr:DUF1552 domain-containing protein [Chthoniobacteraceae bacterium]
MNIALRTPLSRRTFLRGAGATLALPFLESMMPRLGHAAAAPEPPRRFVGMMTNMGILPDYFFPTKEGRDYESTYYLDFLKDHRADMTVFSGVSYPGVDGGHASEKSFLTGAPGASRGSFRNSVSIDQVMAEQLGSATRFPSLTLMIGTENLSLSWTRSGSMIPPLVSPLKLYNKLFVEETPAGKAAAARRLQQDRSLLDGLRAQYKALQQTVTASDRDRLEQYATAVRDLEKALAATEGWLSQPKPKVAVPAPPEIADSNDLSLNSKTLLAMTQLALETDSTRIITVAFSTTSITPKLPGIKSSTHPLTHHGQQPDKIEQLKTIEGAQFAAVADFLTGLKNSKEQGISLLDRTSCVFGTNMGSANSHSNTNLPVLVAGGGFKHGQHVAFDTKNNYNLGNLYVSLLQRIGLPMDKFASGTGTMKGLEMV